MGSKFGLFVGLALLAVMPAVASADSLTLAFSEPFEGKPGPDGTTPWLKAVFTQAGDNTVHLTVYTHSAPDVTPSWGIGTGNFVSELFFNLNDSDGSGGLDLFQRSKMSFSNGTVTSADGTVKTESFVTTYDNGNGSGIGADPYKADGTGGFFDIQLAFVTNSDSRFVSGDRFDIDFSYSGTNRALLAGSFNALASDIQGNEIVGTTYAAAAHIQDISAPAGSTYIAGAKLAPAPLAVPLPAVTWGAGLLFGVIVAARKRVCCGRVA